ncbi:MAG: hypothetical protein ACO3E1_03005 [Flavobacteriales bacterium]
MTSNPWYKKPSVIVLLFLTVFAASTYDSFTCWGGNPHPFISDVDQYYSFLVANTIHNDLGFHFPNQYWLHTTSVGHHVPKVTMGMAYMYSPFFYMAHYYTQWFTSLPADGYSLPYATFLTLGSILYTLLGLFFTRKVLLNFFGEWPIALTLFTLFFGTNLFQFTMGWGLMPHNYLFFLYSLIFYFTIKWHNEQKLKYLLPIGFLIGLSTVIRPLEFLVALIPLLYGITSKETLKAKFKLLKENERQLMYAFIMFCIPIIPQLIYWKWATDSFFHYSYGENERFFFGNPVVLDFLFSYRKGWLLYTPIMIFSLVGFIWKKKFNSAYFSILFLTILMIYILSCWWCWWFGGGFSNRAMIQYYSFLALPLTAFFAFMFERKYLKNLVIILIVFCSYINLLQTYQYKTSTLHWDGMNKAVYWEIFGKWHRDEALTKFIEANVKSPDYEAARNGKR